MKMEDVHACKDPASCLRAMTGTMADFRVHMFANLLASAALPCPDILTELARLKCREPARACMFSKKGFHPFFHKPTSLTHEFRVPSHVAASSVSEV